MRRMEQPYADDALKSEHKKRRTPVGGHAKPDPWTVVDHGGKKKKNKGRSQAHAGK